MKFIHNETLKKEKGCEVWRLVLNILESLNISYMWLFEFFQVWQNYTCEVSEFGLCTTPGRVKPDIYTQLVAAVNESYALQHYTPRLLSLQNCNFVRDTFQTITSSYCPPLEHYLKIVNAGLALISVGVLLCLVLWVLYANRPQREEAFAKLSLPVIGRSKKSSSNNHIHNRSSDVSTSNTSNGV